MTTNKIDNDLSLHYQDSLLTDKQYEFFDADSERSLIVICEAWEDNETLSIDDMCTHLDALVEVLQQKLNFSEFLKKTGITNHNYLN